MKLIDVYPPDYPQSKLDDLRPEDRGNPMTDVLAPPLTMGGYEQLVRGEPFCGKFQHSFENPEPLTPGKVKEVGFATQDVNHTFRTIPDAKPSDFVKATQRVYHGQGQTSGFETNVLVPAGIVPERK